MQPNNEQIFLLDTLVFLCTHNLYTQSLSTHAKLRSFSNRDGN